MFVFQACRASFAHPFAGPNLASLGQCLETDPRDLKMIIDKFTQKIGIHKYRDISKEDHSEVT